MRVCCDDRHEALAHLRAAGATRARYAPKRIGSGSAAQRAKRAERASAFEVCGCGVVACRSTARITREPLAPFDRSGVTATPAHSRSQPLQIPLAARSRVVRHTYKSESWSLRRSYAPTHPPPHPPPARCDDQLDLTLLLDTRRVKAGPGAGGGGGGGNMIELEVRSRDGVAHKDWRPSQIERNRRVLCPLEYVVPRSARVRTLRLQARRLAVAKQ